MQLTLGWIPVEISEWSSAAQIFRLNSTGVCESAKHRRDRAVFVLFDRANGGR